MQLQNGNLVLSVMKQTVGGCNYTSGRVNSLVSSHHGTNLTIRGKIVGKIPVAVRTHRSTHKDAARSGALAGFLAVVDASVTRLGRNGYCGGWFFRREICICYKYLFSLKLTIGPKSTKFCKFFLKFSERSPVPALKRAKNAPSKPSTSA